MSTKDGTEKVKPEPTYTVRTHGNMTTLKVSEEKVKPKARARQKKAYATALRRFDKASERAEIAYYQAIGEADAAYEEADE